MANSRHAIRAVALARAILLLWLGAVAGVATLNAQTLRVSRLANSASSLVAERVLMEAARRAGLPLRLEFHEFPLQRGLALANSGDLDGDMTRPKGIEAQFPNLVRVNVSIVTLEFALYGRTPAIRNLSREEMSRLTFGVPKGMFAAQKLVEGLKSVEGQSFTALFDMLAAGRFDVVVLPYIDAELEIQQSKPPVYLWPQAWGATPFYFMLNRKHQALVAPLDQALAQMEREGAIRKYYLDMLKAKGIEPLKN